MYKPHLFLLLAAACSSDNKESAPDATVAIDAPPVSVDAPPASVDAPPSAVDTTPPTLTILTPRDGLAFDERTVTVTGTVTDDVGVTSVSYVVGSAAAVPVTVDASGGFSFSFTPAPGANAVAITANDAANNAGKATRNAYFGHRISCGNSQSALLANGTLYTWGRNELGQLGNGTLTGTWSSDATVAATLPVMYQQSAPDLVSVVTRQTFMIALAANGTVKTWGANDSGQLGYATPATCGSAGTSSCGRAPAAVDGITDAVAIAAGFNHSLVLRADGTVLAFGSNAKGQLGQDASVASSMAPVTVPGLANIVAIGAGSAHSIALAADGTVYVWGDNTFGQLGTGAADATAHPTPTAIAGLTGASIAGANFSVFVRKPDGTVVAWGQNNNGQIGNGTTTTAFAPTPVLATGRVPLTNIDSIAADGFVAMALDRDGATYAWGIGSLGQLGQGYLADGTTRDLANRSVASKVYVAPGDEAAFKGLEIDVGAGGPAFVWTAQQKLYGWGWSFQGSLGGGTSFINAWAYSAPLLVFPQP